MLKSWKQSEADATSRSGSRGGKLLKLVLHVGPHKTGTTSLQKALLSQYGSTTPQKIWYPQPEVSGPGHALAVWKTLGRKGHAQSPAVRQMIERAQHSNCEVLVLSSEGFASAYPNNIDLLSQQVLDVELHIVVTLSPIAHRAVSVWQETVKHRSPRLLESALGVILSHPGLASNLVRYFADGFPAAKVSIIIADRMEPKTLYTRFANATGIPLSPPSAPGELVANQSLGLVEVNLLSNFNASVAKTGMTLEQYHVARNLLRSQFKSQKWRTIVPQVPIPLPDDWVMPLERQCADTIAELRTLLSQGRIEVFGDIESLNDLDQIAKRSDAPPSPSSEAASSAGQSILIAGLAKSGTTALFYKLKAAMPPDTYCLFEPRKFEAPAAAGARNMLAKVILTVSDLDTFAAFKKNILIVRDPRDRLVSSALYRVFHYPDFCADESKVAEFTNKLRQKEASPESVSVLDLIRLCDRLTGSEFMPKLPDAVKQLVDFKRSHPDFFVYRYEDLVAGKFDLLSEFLGIKLSDDKPSVAAEVSRVTRTKDSGDWRNWFVSEDVTYFRPIFTTQMSHLGYADDWTLAEMPQIATEHSSGYVTRVINERLALERSQTAVESRWRPKVDNLFGRVLNEIWRNRA